MTTSRPLMIHNETYFTLYFILKKTNFHSIKKTIKKTNIKAKSNQNFINDHPKTIKCITLTINVYIIYEHDSISKFTLLCIKF
jgi:hypothetical protein